MTGEDNYSKTNQANFLQKNVRNRSLKSFYSKELFFHFIQLFINSDKKLYEEFEQENLILIRIFF